MGTIISSGPDGSAGMKMKKKSKLKDNSGVESVIQSVSEKNSELLSSLPNTPVTKKEKSSAIKMDEEELPKILVVDDIIFNI